MHPKLRTTALDICSHMNMQTISSIAAGHQVHGKVIRKNTALGRVGLFEQGEIYLSKELNKISCYTWITDDIKELLCSIIMVFWSHKQIPSFFGNAC